MNPSIFAAGAGAGGTGFGLGSLGTLGKTLGSGALSFLKSSGGGAIGSSLLGGLGDEDEESKLEKEKAQSEMETRRWEEKNAVPTAGIGQYLMRAAALEGYPVLGAINNLDFLFNKILPYVGDYGGKIGQTIESGVNKGLNTATNMIGQGMNRLTGAVNRVSNQTAQGITQGVNQYRQNTSGFWNNMSRRYQR